MDTILQKTAQKPHNKETFTPKGFPNYQHDTWYSELFLFLTSQKNSNSLKAHHFLFNCSRGRMCLILRPKRVVTEQFLSRFYCRDHIHLVTYPQIGRNLLFPVSLWPRGPRQLRRGLRKYQDNLGINFKTSKGWKKLTRNLFSNLNSGWIFSRNLDTHCR